MGVLSTKKLQIRKPWITIPKKVIDCIPEFGPTQTCITTHGLIAKVKKFTSFQGLRDWFQSLSPVAAKLRLIRKETRNSVLESFGYSSSYVRLDLHEALDWLPCEHWDIHMNTELETLYWEKQLRNPLQVANGWEFRHCQRWISSSRTLQVGPSHLQHWFYDECGGKKSGEKGGPSSATFGTGRHSSKFELKLSYMRLGLHDALFWLPPKREDSHVDIEIGKTLLGSKLRASKGWEFKQCRLWQRRSRTLRTRRGSVSTRYKAGLGVLVTYTTMSLFHRNVYVWKSAVGSNQRVYWISRPPTPLEKKLVWRM